MARVQEEERILTYHAQNRCFKKYYLGKVHYINPRGIAKSDDSAYREAVQNWRRMKAEMDLAEAARNLGLLSSVKAQIDLPPLPPPTTPVAQERLLVTAADDDFDPTLAANLNVGAAEAGEPEVAAGTGEKYETIRELIDAYLAEKRALVVTKKISRQMFIEYEKNAQVFGEWAEQKDYFRTEQINGKCLDRYKLFILRLADPAFAARAQTSQLGPVTIHKRLARLKNLIEWAWESDQLETLPKKLRKYAQRDRAETDLEKSDEELFWTVDDVREMFKAATPRTRLYILLAANCGYTQADIASLRHVHVDWKTGTITRARHKTKGKQVHKLWAITLHYLRQEATKPDKSQPGGGLVLLSGTGKPLIVDSATTTTREDAIKEAWKWLRVNIAKARLRSTQPELFRRHRVRRNMTAAQRANIDNLSKERAAKIRQAVREELTKENRSFKSFRKTSANLIERQFGDGSKLADQFLGHTQKATKKYYVVAHYERLFEAIDYLDGVFRLAEFE